MVVSRNEAVTFAAAICEYSGPGEDDAILSE